MTERRFPTTTKVTGMIQVHADLLAQHGISAGLESARPAAGTANKYYFSTDTKTWARDNGTTWDEALGFTETEVQNLIDTSIGDHAAVEDVHHIKYTDAEAEAAVKAGGGANVKSGVCTTIGSKVLGTITFGTPFTSIPRVVCTIGGATGFSEIKKLYTLDITTSSFKVRYEEKNGITCPINWIATDAGD